MSWSLHACTLRLPLLPLALLCLAIVRVVGQANHFGPLASAYIGVVPSGSHIYAPT